MTSSHDLSVGKVEINEHAVQLQKTRRKARRGRDAQVEQLYPHVRTFVLKQADAIGVEEACAQALARVPRTFTLVTPDLDDPSRDHLFVGPFPVLSRNHHWDPAFEELSFVTSDGTDVLRGNFRLTHSRLRAYGVLNIGGEPVSVEYHVDPQRYRMKVAKDAAYLSGPQAAITWDTSSDRWTKASWGSDYEVGFTYGVNGEEVVGDEKVYTFVASFDDIPTGRRWEPIPFSYGGFLLRDHTLAFALSSGVKTPGGEGTGLFPYQLRVKLSEFGYDFEGGMVVGSPGYQGTVYGCKGDWAGAHIGGLYRLESDGPVGLVSVHDRTLYAGLTPAAHTTIDGDRLTWSGLPEQAAAEAGIPTEGYLIFSPDGARIVGGFTGGGRRVHPDRLMKTVDELGSAELAAMLSHAREAATAPGHELADLLRMSQYAVDERGNYYDVVQQESMEDFYTILQNYMDSDLRRTFFNPTPPVLEPVLRTIAHTKGAKGTDPIPWYGSLSVPYTATAVGKFSSDPYAATLNTTRAEAWLSGTTSASDVMAAQGPLLYQRRYQHKHDNLEWFLLDQKNSAPSRAAAIDAKAAEWIAQAREASVGTPEQLAEMEKQIRELAEAAKKNKQYWAFTLYAYTMTPAYLNMLQTLMFTGVDVDGSEFSQRVQRTVALLNVLDTSSYFSQQYAYLLQMFQLGSILPQLIDLSGDLKDFQFVVKQILDKFVETYLHSEDPAMREAAEQLRQHASAELVGKMMSILRTSAAVGYGLFNWAFLAQTFERTCAKLLAGVPAVVIRMGALAAAGTLMSFFLSGTVDWGSLSEEQQGFIIFAGVNIVAVNTLGIVKRFTALAEVWSPAKGFFKNARMFFSPKLMTKAQETATGGLRGWLLQEAGPKIPTARLNFKQWWNARKAGAAAPLLPKKGGLIRGLFGKNVGVFMARSLAGAFAIIGIVMSAIDLSKGGEPMEQAVNALFLIASSLELVAVIGGWAMAGSTLAVGGMLVSTIFSVVAVVGFVALLAGAILLIILMTRPQATPVEKFAKDRAGDLYMRYKAAIESFRLYQPLSEPQRSGIALLAGGNREHSLTIGSDGSVTQGPFDATGHTAFYLDTDDRGRAQIGAPILDTEGKQVLQSLAVDEAGAIVSKNYAGDNLPIEPKLLWYADIQDEGSYEESAGGVKELKSAPFKLRSAYWADDRKSTRWLAASSTTGGWRLVDHADEATVIRLEMVATKPAELTMSDVSWLTVAHNERTGPGLQVPGSLPRTWTISPALPEGLVFQPEDGTIAMGDGIDVPPAERRTYRLTVTNALGAAETTFDLEVRVPTEELVLA